MNLTILYTVLALCGVGILSAIILYFVAKKFHVKEDPLIQEVEEVLPGVNCGACGYPGCHQFAEALAGVEDLTKLYCPVGGHECMGNVAQILGKEVVKKDPMVAVLCCSGTPENRPKTNIYDSASSCAVSTYTYSGNTGCQYGCLGLGDCVEACTFDAMYMDPKTELPVIIEEKCTACGACVKACPIDIIELRKVGPKSKRIFVSCVNKDKGGIARKSCKVACIGCGLCVKECPFEAITLENNLAYIDFEKCRLCRKCVVVCPTKAIWELNFPPRPVKKEKEPSEKKSSSEDKKSG